jgi:cytoskeletal protein CcmA (bactofilin family)
LGARVTEVKSGSIISEDTVVEGKLEANGGHIDVYGYVNGDVITEHLTVHPEGKVIGSVNAENVLANGMLQGEAHVRSLINIGATGTVSGDVRYGQLAMEEGAELSANVRNIPPTLAGDLKLTVSKGKAVRLTTDDLTAIDPDDAPEDLTFAVDNMRNGFVVSLDAPKVPAQTFTQAELESGNIVFVHDGKEAMFGSFEVSVTDAAGASSGPAKTVEVEVRG